MEIKSQLETTLRDSMRSGNDVAKRTIRMVMAAIKLAEIENRALLDDASIIAIMHKEIKNRREAIEEGKKANRPDLIADNEAEIAIIEPFLPKGLSDEELLSLVKQAVQEVGAAGPADMGKVMKAVLPRVQGRAPNDKVSLVVRQVIQNL